MSGGCFDYFHLKVEDVAGRLSRDDSRPLRHALAAHLREVAKVMRAVEWEDSGDTGKGDSDAAVRALLGPEREIAAAIKMAEEAMVNLGAAICAAKEKP